MKILILCLMLLMSFGTAFAADDYWVWVDDNGVTNYSEQSPQGYNARHVVSSHRFGERDTFANTTSNDSASHRGSRPGANATQPPPQPAANTDAAKDERAQILAKIAETKRANCEIGKKNLASLQVFTHIRVKDADGKERLLTEKERAARMEAAKETIKVNCSGS